MLVLLVLLVLLARVDVVAGLVAHVYTVVEIDGLGVVEGAPTGGLFFLQSKIPQFFPGQDLEQYLDTFSHQSPKSKHFRFSGNPAFKKQDTFWTAQAETAFAHEL